MSKEAMKLALEALEGINSADNDRDFLGPEECCDLDNAITALQEALAEPATEESSAVQPAAQPQQAPVAWMHEWEDGEKIPMLKGRDDRNQDKPKTVRPLVYGDTSPQPAQPQQELEYCTDYHCAGDCGQPHNQKEMREALAQPQQEPVACGGEQEAPYIGHDCNPALPDTMKVFCPACCTKFRAIPAGVQKLMLDAGFEPSFTSPPAQEFVCSTGLCHYRKPLTDEEIETVWRSVQASDFHDCVKPFARAIEATHGIKGNT